MILEFDDPYFEEKGIVFKAEGNLGIHFTGKIEIYRKGYHGVYQIHDFTGNCGISDISRIRDVDFHSKEHLFLVESFLWHVCKSAIVIGSDQVNAGTYNFIKTYGKDYKFLDPVHNPNYPHQPTHLISIFYKDLHGTTYPNYWGRSRDVSVQPARQANLSSGEIRGYQAVPEVVGQGGLLRPGG